MSGTKVWPRKLTVTCLVCACFFFDCQKEKEKERETNLLWTDGGPVRSVEGVDEELDDLADIKSGSGVHADTTGTPVLEVRKQYNNYPAGDYLK